MEPPPERGLAVCLSVCLYVSVCLYKCAYVYVSMCLSVCLRVSVVIFVSVLRRSCAVLTAISTLVMTPTQCSTSNYRHVFSYP